MKAGKYNFLKRMEPFNDVIKDCRCLSDRVLAYYNHACDKLDIHPNTRLIEFYTNLRVDGYFGFGFNPRSVAAGLVWLTCIKLGIPIGQKEIAGILKCNLSTIHKHFWKLEKLYEKMNEIVDEKRVFELRAEIQH